MEKRLWQVEVETQMFVWAEDDVEAERLAERHVHDEPLSAFARLVTARTVVTSDEAASLVWGMTEDKTVEQCIQELKDKVLAEEVDARQLVLPCTDG
jgi:hypothetical protein